jgi:hypothetical protein
VHVRLGVARAEVGGTTLRNLPKRPETCSFEVGDTMQVSANAPPLIASARVKRAACASRSSVEKTAAQR